MKVCKRILAAVTALFCVAGLLICIAVVVGVWIVKGPVTSKATTAFGRIEGALEVADRGLDRVKSSFDKADERLAIVKEEQAKLAQDPKNNRPVARAMARSVQQTIAPEFQNAHETFHTVAEAAVVVQSILDDLASSPMLSVPGLEGDDMAGIDNSLSQVESSAWELGRLLGEPEPDSEAAGSELSRIERTLAKLRELITHYKSRLTQVRQKTEELKSTTLYWITPAALIISLVCLWIALSQVSLLCHARSWWRQSRCDNPSREIVTGDHR
jgi:hypothetical protein